MYIHTRRRLVRNSGQTNRFRKTFADTNRNSFPPRTKSIPNITVRFRSPPPPHRLNRYRSFVSQRPKAIYSPVPYVDDGLIKGRHHFRERYSRFPLLNALERTPLTRNIYVDFRFSNKIKMFSEIMKYTRRFTICLRRAIYVLRRYTVSTFMRRVNRSRASISELVVRV